MRPLHVLVFLSPLLIAYELGSALYLTDEAAGITRSVAAHRLFGDFFQIFGLYGAAFLPGIALVVVLLCWHIFVRDKWRVDGQTLAGMFLESIAWTLPLLVLAASINHARTSLGVASLGTHDLLLAAQNTGTDAAGEIGKLPTMARATIAVGAGLYEEMLFRLVGLALLHFILADLIGLSHRWAYAVAIVVSALAFAVYHRVSLPTEWAYFAFTSIAGIYFGTVYVMRGFGIVVMTHAMYDVLVLVVFPGLSSHT